MAEELITFPFAELYIRRDQASPTLQDEGPLVISSLPGPEVASDGGASSTVRMSVGSTSWEVTPASRVLRTGEHTYVFNTAETGVFYSVTLLATTEPEDVGIFEAVLENIALLRESEALLTDPEVQSGDSALAGVAYRSALARGVQRASSGLAGGLAVSAAYASGALSRAASAARPAQPTCTPVEVSEATQLRFERTATAARWASGAAGALVGGLAWAGSKAADGVLWALGADAPLEAGQEPGVLRETSHAAAAGFSQVWEGMEDAGRQVLLSARDGTATVVADRYGPDAAQLSVHSMNTAGHGVDAVYAVRKLGPRTVAKAAAKRTARNVIKNMGRSGPQAPGPAAVGARAETKAITQ